MAIPVREDLAITPLFGGGNVAIQTINNSSSHVVVPYHCELFAVVCRPTATIDVADNDMFIQLNGTNDNTTSFRLRAGTPAVAAGLYAFSKRTFLVPGDKLRLVSDGQQSGACSLFSSWLVRR